MIKIFFLVTHKSFFHQQTAMNEKLEGKYGYILVDDINVVAFAVVVGG